MERFIDHQFELPTYMAQIPDGSGRFLVLEKQGLIYIVSSGQVVEEPYLDIRHLVDSDNFERGLLGLAFHPNFRDNGFFYIDYTRAEDGDTMIERYRRSLIDPNKADPTTRVLIMRINQPNEIHNGGMLEFGPDGYLYVGVGDGGGAKDPQRQAQNTYTLLGSILRLDVDQPSEHGNYSIPYYNPFADELRGRPEIWVYGLRNPWRFSFDRETDDLWIADVGQEDWEEINFKPARTAAGDNFGWSAYEGFEPFNEPEIQGTQFPILAYDHRQGCAITGGYVYRGEVMPELDGNYFYGDYCFGYIWMLSRNEFGAWENTYVMDSIATIMSFAQDLTGELYVVDRAGWIFKLVPADTVE